ncbi:MAG: hypothetical protein AAGH46_07535 [Bacteroidota bacterium]
MTACKQESSKPLVSAVYPSSNELPENLLRIYIQFSKPMKTLGNIEKIKLVDIEGNEVKTVFFNNAKELWNSQQTRLSLILDPARVKTGLRANEDLGHALKPNHDYTLIIEGLEDVKHQQMSTTFKKKISITAADTLAPEINNWKLNIPKAKSTSNFTVSFPYMLDYISLQQRLIVTDTNNNPIEGLIKIKNKETQWCFQPKKPWENGRYILHINSRLEDPSGNNLNGLFDHKRGSLKNKQEGVMKNIPFEIK